MSHPIVFIELHDRDGEPHLINVSQIATINRHDAGHAQLCFVGDTYDDPFFEVSEKYERVRTLLYENVRLGID